MNNFRANTKGRPCKDYRNWCYQAPRSGKGNELVLTEKLILIVIKLFRLVTKRATILTDGSSLFLF